MRRVTTGPAPVLACATVLALSGPTLGADLRCTGKTGVNWSGGTAHVIEDLDKTSVLLGPVEFRLDTETGRYRDRRRALGDRASAVGGGTYTIIADGTGDRRYWVGHEMESSYETLRIDLARDPMPFLRAGDEIVEIGTCTGTESAE